MPKRTKDYRIGLLEELKDPAAALAYLNAALEESEEMFRRALRDVFEAQQVAVYIATAGPRTKVSSGGQQRRPRTSRALSIP